MKFLVEFNSAIVAWLSLRGRVVGVPINCYLNFGGLTPITPIGDGSGRDYSLTVRLGISGQLWQLYPGSGTFRAYMESKITSSSIDIVFTPIQEYTGEELDVEEIIEVSRSNIPGIGSRRW